MLKTVTMEEIEHTMKVLAEEEAKEAAKKAKKAEAETEIAEVSS
jgi:hypothetical protein